MISDLSPANLLAIIETDGIRPGVLARLADSWAPLLRAAMTKYEIATPRRMAHFVAQTAHESGRFHYVKELWGPTKAQAGYEGRRDLGNTVTGDGFRFRGRGLIQITGRANYREAADALGLPLLLQPELLERPDLAALSGAWWWHKNGLNALADTGNIDHVSDRINRGRITASVGDANGYTERKLLTEKALSVLGGA
jgi:putative chitinase